MRKFQFKMAHGVILENVGNYYMKYKMTIYTNI